MRRHLIAFAALALGCAHNSGWMPGWEGLQTRHFTIYTPEPRDVRPLLFGLELESSALQTFFAHAELPHTDILAPDPAQFTSSYGRSRAGMALTASPGASPVGKHGLLVLTTNRPPHANNAV